MARIIALAQSKRDVGKTTCLNLAGELHHRGLSVAVLDADLGVHAIATGESGKLLFSVSAHLLDDGDESRHPRLTRAPW